jgi:hypothetical protein
MDNGKYLAILLKLVILLVLGGFSYTFYKTNAIEAAVTGLKVNMAAFTVEHAQMKGLLDTHFHQEEER